MWILFYIGGKASDENLKPKKFWQYSLETDDFIYFCTSIKKTAKQMKLKQILNFNIMETIELMNYEVPKVEIIEVEVEKGFSNSLEDLENETWN